MRRNEIEKGFAWTRRLHTVLEAPKFSADFQSAVSQVSNLLRTVSCLTFILLFPIIANGEPTNTPPSLKEVGQAMSKVNTVFTRFVQERHLSLFNEPLRSEGALCFQKPGCIRWEIQSPYKSILVSDGSGVAQFEWVDDKWKKLDLGLANAMQNVISQIGAVMEGRYAADQREYEVSLTRSDDNIVITLLPRHEMMRKMIKAIEVHLSSDLTATRRIVLREKDGDYTDIRFSNQHIGVQFPKGTFDRNAPLDLDQVHPQPAGPESKTKK